MSRHYNYAALLRQRAFMTGLTLGLVTIMTGIGIELAVTSQRTTISDSVQKLIQPLDPLLDLKTVEKLESYTFVPLETARQKVRQTVAAQEATPSGELALPGFSEPTPLPSPSPSPSPTPIEVPAPGGGFASPLP